MHCWAPGLVSIRMPFGIRTPLIGRASFSVPSHDTGAVHGAVLADLAVAGERAAEPCAAGPAHGSADPLVGTGERRTSLQRGHHPRPGVRKLRRGDDSRLEPWPGDGTNETRRCILRF